MLSYLKKTFNRSVIAETQRQSFERIVSELNGLIETMPIKPSITIHPETGFIALDLPDQMPDEALALPSPEEKEAA